MGGGFGNAIVGTLVMVGIASLISVPIGILGAVFLAEVGPETKLAKAVRFLAKVLDTASRRFWPASSPTARWCWLTGGFSARAGGVALSILMLPTVMLTAEEAIRMVPCKMQEAAIGMGARQTQVVLVDSVADGHARHPHRRDAGGRPRRGRNGAAALHRAVQQLLDFDTNRSTSTSMQPTASLAVLIYNFSGVPFQNQVETGVGAVARPGAAGAGRQLARSIAFPRNTQRKESCTMSPTNPLLAPTARTTATPSSIAR